MAGFHQSSWCLPLRTLPFLALGLILLALLRSSSAASAYGTIGGTAGSAGVSHYHSLSKRSYFDINCKGLYDKSIFGKYSSNTSFITHL